MAIISTIDSDALIEVRETALDTIMVRVWKDALSTIEAGGTLADLRISKAQAERLAAALTLAVG